MGNNFKKLYQDDYFKERSFQDKKRLECFEQEKRLIYKYIKSAKVCDVGCSTGEFLKYIDWDGDKYGMEINEYAIQLSKQNGINFEKNIFTEKFFFDIVIFRGTIQHIPNPFYYIEQAYNSLKTGGIIVFLATPNMNSLYYKCFNTLPMLDDEKNFYIPSDLTLSNALRNFGFKILEIEKPYFSSPYAQLTKDHIKFIKKFLFRTDDKFAFYGSMFNLIAKK